MFSFALKTPFCVLSKDMTSLAGLKKNQVGRIVSFDAGDSSKALCFMEMGLACGSKIQLIERLKGILIFLTKHGKYSVRTKDCRFIKVEVLSRESL